MNTKQKVQPLALTLLKTQRKYNKDYSWPSQKTIIENMARYIGIRKSKATLNRWLKSAEDEGYLIRKRRIKRHTEYGMIFKSTLYKITIKGLKVLSMFGVDVNKEIAVYNAWLREKNPKPEKAVELNTRQKPGHKRINQLLNKLGVKFIT